MIATYFSPVPMIDETKQIQILNLFMPMWKGACQVGLSQAKQHARFDDMVNLLSTYPEVTPRGYRDQCFFRWLAFDVMSQRGAPILILDYDVFPLVDNAFQWLADRFTRPTVLNYTNPCAVFLPDACVLSTIVKMLFMPTIPDSEPSGLHVGDNTVFAQHWRNIGDTADVVSEYPCHAKQLLHFANRCCPNNKPEVIRNMLHLLNSGG